MMGAATVREHARLPRFSLVLGIWECKAAVHYNATNID